MIDFEDAQAVFRHQLEGFTGYPRPDGRFIEVFQESAISLDHARAIVESFESSIPTLAEIRDTARNLRPKFEVVVPPEVEWRRRYGRPDPEWSRNLAGSYQQQKARMLWQSIRDCLFYVEGPGESTDFWVASLRELEQRHPAAVENLKAEICRRGWTDIMREDWAGEVQAAGASL